MGIDAFTVTSLRAFYVGVIPSPWNLPPAFSCCRSRLLFFVVAKKLNDPLCQLRKQLVPYKCGPKPLFLGDVPSCLPLLLLPPRRCARTITTTSSTTTTISTTTTTTASLLFPLLLLLTLCDAKTRVTSYRGNARASRRARRHGNVVSRARAFLPLPLSRILSPSRSRSVYH